jgi:hypothetical protein
LRMEVIIPRINFVTLQSRIVWRWQSRLVFRWWSVWVSARSPTAIMTETFCSFPRSLQANAKAVARLGHFPPNPFSSLCTNRSIIRCYTVLSLTLSPSPSPSPYGSTILVDLGHFLSFLILYTVGRTPWMGDQPVARSLSTSRTTQTRIKSIETSMTRVGFEPTIPVVERAKTVHALDSMATVIDMLYI